MHKLLVLMWKHFKVRTRRFIKTPVEFLAPVIVFGLMLWLMLMVINESSETEINKLNPKLAPEVDPVEIEHEVSLSVFYTPSNEFTDSLMDIVGRNLKINRTSDYKKVKYEFYYGVPETMDLDLIISNITEFQALIIFGNMQRYPDQLNYTIRIRSPFEVHKVQSLDGGFTHHKSFGVDYFPFIRLQWGIDKAYIEKFTGEQVTQSLVIQEFPFMETPVVAPRAWIASHCGAMHTVALFLPFVFLMTRLVVERVTGVQELIKMAGVGSYTLAFSHFLNMVPVGLVFAIVTTVLVKVKDVTPESNSLFLLFETMLNFVVVVLAAFTFSFLTKSTQYATTVATLSYTVLFLCENLVPSLHSRFLASLLPHQPARFFWEEVSALEKQGKGLNFTTMFSSHAENSLPAATCLVMMACHAVLLAALVAYLLLVCPGPYGVPKPWDFLWKRGKVSTGKYLSEEQAMTDDERLFESPPPGKEVGIRIEDVSKRTPPSTVDVVKSTAADPRLFEPTPADAEVGIRVDNVTKVYGKATALSGVSLAVYSGEITVLLGHNGAGKTTLMSIITGMTTATRGSVSVAGRLGLCTQHNLFVPELTVREHVRFFAMLKGQSWALARSAASTLLSEVGLSAKAGSLVGPLSGGMRRRVQLACALAGDAAVLVLDEPTSGLDVETRREMWDLLLSLRGKRTVLLSTHFMEEADALGDRAAALHRGRLRCHATPMHLKRHLGGGYRLTLTTVDAPRIDALSQIVTSTVGSEAMLRVCEPRHAEFALPAAAAAKFPALFRELESRRSELGVDSIGVGMPTLEEVFLRLCSNVDTQFSEDETDNLPIPESVPVSSLAAGPRLWARQFAALAARQIRYQMASPWAFLILQVLIPIAMICLSTRSLLSEPVRRGESTLALRGAAYDSLGAPRALLGPGVGAVADDGLSFERTGDVGDEILRLNRDNATEYRKFILGIDFNETVSMVYYTTIYRHAAPIGVNILTNAILATRFYNKGVSMGRSPTGVPIMTPQVHAENRPLPPHRSHHTPATTLEPVVLVIWSVYLVFLTTATIGQSAMERARSRLSGTRAAHFRAGAAPATHWLAAAAVHAAQGILLLIVPAIIALLIWDSSRTLAAPYALCGIFLVMSLGLLAWLAFAYLLSLRFGDKSISAVLIVAIIVAIIASYTALMFSQMDAKPAWYARPLLGLSWLLLPPYAMVAGLAKTGQVATKNADCHTIMRAGTCPELTENWKSEFVRKCCVLGENPESNFTFDKDHPGPEMLLLALQCFMYMLLVILSEMGYTDRVLACCVWRYYRAPAPRQRDPMAAAERVYVEKAISMPRKQVPDAMLVSDVHKKYYGLFKSAFSVRGVSFSVKKGECFGVLGVNGAGKTSLFRCIAGELGATRGRLLAHGHTLDGQRNQEWNALPASVFPDQYNLDAFKARVKAIPRRACFIFDRIVTYQQYLRSLSHCPQFFGLDTFLTGEQNLRLLLTLRGLPPDQVAKHADAWIKVVGLEQYRLTRVSGYSGGCQRRLAAAGALCGGAGGGVALLDEPTSGVDVAARRRVWAAVKRAQQQRRAVVITSHSMDEMEALCGRIAIMAGGEVCALGSPAELRAAHAAGHAVVVKLQHQDSARDEDPGSGARRGSGPGGIDEGRERAVDETDESRSVTGVKVDMQATFNCELKDEHKTMLRYHINETMPYSELFMQLERMKEKFSGLIEDYTVTETTLEEVFLSFAQDKDEAPTESPTPV